VCVFLLLSVINERDAVAGATASAAAGVLGRGGGEPRDDDDVAVVVEEACSLAFFFRNSPRAWLRGRWRRGVTLSPSRSLARLPLSTKVSSTSTVASRNQRGDSSRPSHSSGSPRTSLDTRAPKMRLHGVRSGRGDEDHSSKKSPWLRCNQTRVFSIPSSPRRSGARA